MTDALRAAGFTIVAALAAFALRAVHRQSGAAVALAAGLMEKAAGALESLSSRAGVGQETVGMILKLLGMAYVTEFAVQSCRDAGEEGLAAKATLCGKMLLLLQTLPLILEIGDLTLSLLP